MPAKGNILLVANWESDVGYAWWLMENFWIAIAEHFANHDMNCFLIYPKITRPPVSIASSCIIALEHDFRNDTGENRKNLKKLINDYTIRYIYLTDSPAYCMHYARLKTWGIEKIVVHDHTPGERTSPAGLKKLLKCIVNNIPLITADRFVAVTDYVYQRFVDVNCIPRSKCAVAANGIVPLDISKADHGYAHRVFDIAENSLIVVTIGRATYYKGIDFFIECANELINNQGMHGLHFLYCGDGPDIKDFKRLCTKYGLDDNFTFAGKRPDIRELLPSCDVGMHASHGEVGYSLSILEYMSAGLATIVPDNPSTSGATRDGITGIVYKSNDLASACDAIKQCCSIELRRQLAKNAINAVEKQYNLADTNRQLISILQETFIENK